MEDYNRLWEESEWCSEAREIIQFIQNLPKDADMILILRHSERYTSDNLRELHKLLLTSQGHDIAKVFGSKIPIDKKMIVYHSIVLRCLETAQDILKGFELSKGSGEIKGTLEPLYTINGDRDFLYTEMFKQPGAQFLEKWAQGRYPSKKIEPLENFCQNARRQLWTDLITPARKAIYLHVTHDLMVMALRYGWLGLRPGTDWVKYLGGLVIAIFGDTISIYDSISSQIKNINLD